MRKLVLFACLPILMSVVAVAQVPAVTGTTQTPLLNSDHNYIQSLNEIVDPAMGSLSIRIAAPSPHERGPNLPKYAFIYDSASEPQNTITPEWNVPTDAYSGMPDNPPALGPFVWGNVDPVPQYLGAYLGAPNSVSYQQLSQFLQTSADSGNSISCSYLSDFVYTDPDGGNHNLDVQWVNYGQANAQTSCDLFGILEYLQGGDEYYQAVVVSVDAGEIPTVQVVDSHGTVVFPAVEDTNGNGPDGTGRAYSIQIGGQSWLDYPMLTSTTIPGLGTPYSISYESVPINLNLNFTLTSASFANSCALPQQVSSGAATMSVPENVILPNGQQYSFGYDPTFGFINHITYPTGETVDYTWNYIPQSEPGSYGVQWPVNYLWPGYNGTATCEYRYDWMGISKRVVSIGGVPTLAQDFSYNTNWSGSTNQWITKTTTVTTRDLTRAGTPSSETIYTYIPGGGQAERNRPPGVIILEAGPLESTIQYYDTNGALLRTISKSWYAGGKPALLAGECEMLDNGKTSGTFYQYEGNTDLKTDVAEYDYNQNVIIAVKPNGTSSCQRPSSPAPRRETFTSYQTFGTTPIFSNGPSILDRPFTVKVYGDGALLSETIYAYDGSSVSPVIEAIGHDETNYAYGSSAPRGNVTSVTKKCLYGGCSADAITHYTYDETGQVISTIDPNNNPLTYYFYTDAYASGDGSVPVINNANNTNTYLTKIIYPGSHIVSFTYVYNDGKMRSSTDENLQTTTYCYFTGGCNGASEDPWARLTEIDYPDGGQTKASFSDAGPNPNTVIQTKLNPNTNKTTETVMDESGRVISTEITSDPNGTDEMDTTYDGLGRVSTQSNWYRSGSPSSTNGTTTYNYDALSRKIVQVDSDGVSTQSWSYLGNTVTYNDENHNQWLRMSDALGRLVGVREPSGTSKSPSMQTYYQYNGLDDLLLATQCGGSCQISNQVTRSFSYDSLSRLSSSTNPETGTIGYTYDPNGNLRIKTDARGVTTSYQYDSLNRLLSKSYSGDTSNTPYSCYQYDTSSSPLSNSNLIGRLTNAWTQSNSVGSCPSSAPTTGFLTKRALSYDPMGRLSSELQYTPANQASNALYNPQYTYDLAGNLTSSTDGVTPIPPSNVVAPLCAYPSTTWTTLTFTNCYDGAGHLQSQNSNWSDATHPQALFTSTSNSSLPPYAPFGGLQSATFGNGLGLARTYDSRLRITSETDTGSIITNATTGSTMITITGTGQSQ